MDIIDKIVDGVNGFLDKLSEKKPKKPSNKKSEKHLEKKPEKPLDKNHSDKKPENNANTSKNDDNIYKKNVSGFNNVGNTFFQKDYNENITAEYFSGKGNGNLIQRKKSFDNFTKIKSSGIAKVRYHSYNESNPYIILTVDENLEKFVKIEVEKNRLCIGVERGSYSFTEFTVDVFCDTLTGIKLSGSSRIKLTDELHTDELDIDISGSGDVSGRVICELLVAEISGSGRITLSGKCENKIDMLISGSGSFYGYDLKCENARVNISGTGNAEIYVVDDLKAKVSGMGKITYKGKPVSVDKTVTGLGKISEY